MSRPARHFLPAISLAAALLLGGCHTIYSDTYSPRRNRFKPEPVKKEPSIMLPPIPETTGPSATPGVPGQSTTPSTGMPDATTTPSLMPPPSSSMPGM